MLQNTPLEIYVHIGCASSLYLFEDLCAYGADIPKQDACYCEFYWAVNFVVRDTVTSPYFIVVRNTVAIQQGVLMALVDLFESSSSPPDRNVK